ncbi:hypothetical protein B0H13DRAFT_1916738 [Mycena leptocephala]|nr:hypothetical protein B0H13DRAFT_1916738 [Mycena leptocephala]
MIAEESEGFLTHAVITALDPSGHLLVSFLFPCRFTLLNMPTNHPPLTGDFRNVRFGPHEDDHLANHIASHKTLSTSRYNATLYAVLGPMSVLEAPEEFVWSRHHPSASWMNRYRNQRSKFDVDIKRSKQEKTHDASVPPSASSAVSVAASPQNLQASATVRLPETPSKQSTILGFCQPNANDTPLASSMRPLSSLIDTLLMSTSKLVDKPAATVTSAAVKTLHRGQLTRRPNRPKLSIPSAMPASQCRPLPMISSPVRPYMIGSFTCLSSLPLNVTLTPAQLNVPTSGFILHLNSNPNLTLKPIRSAAQPNLNSSCDASNSLSSLHTRSHPAAANAGVDKQLLKLCRKGKCIFTVDYVWARTEVVLSEMAATAEARGAEVLGVNGGVNYTPCCNDRAPHKFGRQAGPICDTQNVPLDIKLSGDTMQQKQEWKDAGRLTAVDPVFLNVVKTCDSAFTSQLEST